MKRKRIHLNVEQHQPQKPRPKEYLNLRFHWLHQIRQLKAKRRISGTASTKDIKIAQKELARIRKVHK